LYGYTEAADGRRLREQFCVGFRLAFDPCKGILQARLSRHYREIFAAVVGRIRAWSGRDGGIFGQSEALQGFGWISRLKIFFLKF